jgi:prepilin-type N-terminal cleavage/methylation domain-containing protein
MKHARRRILSDHQNDTGLTLIEVLAAVIIVVIVALAGAGLTINGIQTAAAQERTQVAVVIANGAMEKVSGTAVSDLTLGRYGTAAGTPVAKSFSDNSTQPGISQTYPSVDPAATASSTANVAITAGSTSAVTSAGTQNGTNYLITTVIGTCYQAVTGGNCGKIAAYPTTPPATVPAAYTKLVRVVVLVKWTAGAGCVANGCYYETSTLADPNADPEWLTHA